jgi:hypothetical protein
VCEPERVDDLVEAAAVDPGASAIGAIVDLDALAVSHLQRDIADWALHAVTQSNCVAAWFDLEAMPDDTLRE